MDPRAVLDPGDLTAALDLLDPGSRALLDLSLRWGVEDARIARLLRTDERGVARRRAGVVEQVAAHMGVDPLLGAGGLRDALARLPPPAWGVPVPDSARRAVEPQEEKPPAPVIRLPAPVVGLVPHMAAPLAEAPPVSRAVLPTVRRGARAMLTLALGAVIGAALGRRLR